MVFFTAGFFIDCAACLTGFTSTHLPLGAPHFCIPTTQPNVLIVAGLADAGARDVKPVRLNVARYRQLMLLALAGLLILSFC